MKTKLFWPKCNFQKKQWTNEVMDSYWVQCTFDEAENEIFPYLSALQIEESMRNWEPKANGLDPSSEEQNALYFLISKDLNSIEAFPWYYPYSGQWNAYCPFEKTEEVVFSNINELHKILHRLI